MRLPLAGLARLAGALCPTAGGWSSAAARATPGLARGMSQPAVEAARSESERIRDFAIIAHVDHGKTTLMDKIIFSGTDKAQATDRVMDSGVFEKERGITITSKYTSFAFKGHTLNAVDTPGHADFGGEVERCGGMGPLP